MPKIIPCINHKGSFYIIPIFRGIYYFQTYPISMLDKCDFLLHAPGIYPFSGPNPEYPLACVIFCHQNIMKPQLWTTNPPKTHKIR